MLQELVQLRPKPADKLVFFSHFQYTQVKSRPEFPRKCSRSIICKESQRYALKNALKCGIIALLLANSSPALSFAADLSTIQEQEAAPIPKFFPPLRDITLPDIEKVILPNGLRVFLLEDHELGLISGQLTVHGGSKLEPENKVGLATITAAVQRSGGTNSKPADALDLDLEAMAARVEASAGVSTMSVGFRCLGEDLNTVFALFSDVVQKPAMPQEKLDFIRSQLLGAIARREDDVEGIASREFRKLIYGSKSVYARVPEVETVKAIDRSDLFKFHNQVFRPDKAVLGIWGDFDSSRMRTLVEQQFDAWVGTENSTDEVVNEDQVYVEPGISMSQPGTFFVNRPGLTQGYVRMGELGTTLLDPDVFSLDVLNGILNGFGGLLFDEVRTREGLAYSVSGGWSPSVEHRGIFVAGGATQISSLTDFVEAVKRVLEAVTREPPTSEQLAQAKEAVLNSFVFNFSDRELQLARAVTYNLFGIDEDYPFKYKKGVEEVKAEDVLRAAQRHLHPNSQPILIVTDVQKFQGQRIS